MSKILANGWEVHGSEDGIAPHKSESNDAEDLIQEMRKLIEEIAKSKELESISRDRIYTSPIGIPDELQSSAMQDEVTRPELDAKLEAIEARMDARVAGIEAKIDGLGAELRTQATVSSHAIGTLTTSISAVSERVSEVNQRVEQGRSEGRNQFLGILALIVASGLAIYFGITSNNASLQSNVLAGFQSGAASLDSARAAAREEARAQSQIIAEEAARKALEGYGKDKVSAQGTLSSPPPVKPAVLKSAPPKH